MELILIAAALPGCFLLIGIVAALRMNRRPEKRGEEPEEPPRVMIARQVPSVFDFFRGGR